MFTLDHVVPWGRSFDEYRRMFALSDDDLRLKIIGCGDGPASFNSVATRHGSSVVSCDPIYRYDLDRLRERIAATYDEILKQTRQNAKEFVWTSIRSPEELGETRMAANDSSPLQSSSGLRRVRVLCYSTPVEFALEASAAVTKKFPARRARSFRSARSDSRSFA